VRAKAYHSRRMRENAPAPQGEGRPRFFYGYVVVFGAWLAMFVTGGAQFSFSIFLPSLLEDFGGTRGMLSLGFTLNMVLVPVIGLLGGYLVERIGPARTVVIGAIIGGSGVALVSTVSQIWQFILLYGLLVPAGIGLSYIIVTVSTVRRWFMRKAGGMVALAMSGSGLGIVFLVIAANAMIESWGWRTSYLALGVILLVGAVMGGLLLKKDPESVGTYPDGVKPTEEELKSRADFMARNEKWSVREAFKSSSWWLFIGAQLGSEVALLGFLVHLIVWGSLDLGIPRGTMVLIYSYGFVLAAVLGRLFGGFISDWYMARFGISRKPILYLATLGVGLGAFLCLGVGGVSGIVLVSLLLGFCYGSGLAVFPTYLGDLFGVRNVSVLYGAAGLFVGVIGAAGPVFFGFSYDATGSYNLAFMVTGVVCLISALCLVRLNPPRRREAGAVD